MKKLCGIEWSDDRRYCFFYYGEHQYYINNVEDGVGIRKVDFNRFIMLVDSDQLQYTYDMKLTDECLIHLVKRYHVEML